jgi:lysine 6-dehydrogenase
MNHFLVLGAGKMGIVLAKDLVESDAKNKVTLVDVNKSQLKKASAFIRSRRLVPLQRDLEDEKARFDIFQGKEVALSALLHKHSMMALETAVQTRVHFVDLVGEEPLARHQFDGLAKKRRLTILSGCGVSPGITNVCVGRAVYLLDEAQKALIYIGGNPVHPRPPLKYRIVYAIDSLLNFYERKVSILKNGKIKKVPPLSGVESISFDAPFSEMECFYTDGLSSLLYTMEEKIRDELWEKTIRHKGHIREIRTLKSCGLFSTRPISIGDKKVRPREVLQVLLEDRMKLGKEKDVTLMRIIISGKKSGRPVTHVFEMIDHYDSEKACTSMARTTCFPASIAAQMILSGMIRQRGSLFPEEVFQARLFKPFMRSLKAKGIIISHRTFSDFKRLRY